MLVALARLIRALHDASAGWTPPRDAIWGGIPGTAAAALPPVDREPELVSHRDYCPGNVVFRGGLPAALIDFDLAKPGEVDRLAQPSIPSPTGSQPAQGINQRAAVVGIRSLSRWST